MADEYRLVLIDGKGRRYGCDSWYGGYGNPVTLGFKQGLENGVTFPSAKSAWWYWFQWQETNPMPGYKAMVYKAMVVPVTKNDRPAGTGTAAKE